MERLANGLRVLTVQNPALHSFVLSMYVHAGPRFESPDRTGLGHLVEHMLMQGSESYPTSSAIMRGIEDLGGVVDAGTYPEYVNVVFGVHRKHWRKALDIAADVIRRPLFDEDELDQERRIIAQEISEHRDTDGRVISATELAYCLRFRRRVDEAGSRGSRAALARYDRAVLVAYHNRFYTPSNMVVCVAGAFDRDAVLNCLGESLGDMDGNGAPQVPVAPPDGAVADRSFYRTTPALPVADAVISRPAYALGDASFDACRAVGHLLGGGLSSRLFSRVREELGLVYDIHGRAQGYSDAGTLDIVLSVNTGNLVRAVEAALNVLRETGEKGFAEEELERYKEGIRCGVEMLCDRASALADWFGRQELLLGSEGVTTPEEYAERHESMELKDLAAAARELLSARPSDLVVVGPYGEGELAGLRRAFPAEEVTTSGALSG